MTFNQFQRELQERGIDPKVAYMLTVIYEQVMEQGKRIDDCASVLLNMAHTVRGLTGLNEQTAERLRRIERGGDESAGIEVRSVAYDPDDK